MKQFSLKDLLNFLPIAVAIAEDGQCRKVTVNRMMAKTMANYHSEEIEEYASFLTNPLYKVFHDRTELSEADLPLRRAVLNGETVSDYVMDVVRPNGSVATITCYAMPWRQGDKITGGVAAYIDTTDLRIARAEISLLKEQLSHMVNNLKEETETEPDAEPAPEL